MKCYFFETEQIPFNLLEQTKTHSNINCISGSVSTKNVNEFKDAEIICVFSSNINEGVLNKLPNLKVIITRSTGVDHIDIELCNSKSIIVRSLMDYSSISVAEFTISLILNISRNIFKSRLFDNGTYDYLANQGFDLYGKTIGVVGAGEIGKKVIKLATSFGMRALIFDRKYKCLDSYESVVDLESLIKNSDIITLHIPLSSETRHMIAENLQFSKIGAILINTSRAGLINQSELLKYLKNGHLASVALDCLDFQEKNNIAQKLLSLDNFIYTPHIGFNTYESVYRSFEKSLKILNEYL